MNRSIKKYFLLLSFFTCLTTVAQQQFSFTTEAEIYVVGDIHGAYHEVTSTLKNLNLIDEDNNWAGGNAHFVSLGDLVDRGPSARKVMDLFMNLQIQAEKAGGQFHIVLGNHEMMNLQGDWRYLSVEEINEFAADESIQQRTQAYQQFIQWYQLEDNEGTLTNFNNKYPAGFFAHYEAFNINGKYGQWLLQLPFIIKINDQLFTHGGLSKSIKNTELKKINDTLKSNLTSYIKSRNHFVNNNQLLFDMPFNIIIEKVKTFADSDQKNSLLSVVNNLVFSIKGPSWYRGNSLCHPYFEQDILVNNLKQWDAKRLWVGHTTTPTKTVQQRFSNQLVMMDTGMLRSYYNGQPWVAKIQPDGTTSFINGLTTKTGEAIPAAKREFSNPYGMNDAELEDFLKTAEITSKIPTDEGKTKPFKVTLEKDGKKVFGIFKYKDTHPKANKGKWHKSRDSADRYQYEVAAYRLDRILDINLVPVTIVRKIGRQKGIVQIWIDGLATKLALNEHNVKYTGFCNKNAQLNMMDTFDYLIANRDRNLTNIIYSISDWQLWFIDHSRSFSTSTQRPSMIKDTKIYLSDAFRVELEKLTKGQLRELRPWLHSKQISAIWKRRNKLLSGKF